MLIHITDNGIHTSNAEDSPESLMNQVVKLDIQYLFGYIDKKSTDQMIDTFNDHLKQLSNQRCLIRQFDAIDPDLIEDAVKRFALLLMVNPMS